MKSLDLEHQYGSSLNLINPISTGEWNPPLSGFSSITQKRKKVFSSNLVTFFIDKWVTTCTFKLEDRLFFVVKGMAQIKGVQK